jgi:hypothetical protein
MDDVAILLVKHGADMNLPDAEGQRVVTHSKGTHVSSCPSGLLCLSATDLIDYFYAAAALLARDAVMDPGRHHHRLHGLSRALLVFLWPQVPLRSLRPRVLLGLLPLELQLERPFLL